MTSQFNRSQKASCYSLSHMYFGPRPGSKLCVIDFYPLKFLLWACRAFLLSLIFCLQWECLLAFFSRRNVFDKVNAKAEVSLYQTNHDIDLLHLVNPGPWSFKAVRQCTFPLPAWSCWLESKSFLTHLQVLVNTVSRATWYGEWKCQPRIRNLL